MKSIATAIRQRGFRKWYERELLTGHSHLVLLLLCAVALLGALEALSGRTGVDRWAMVFSFAAAGVLGVWAMRRYLFHLMRAETVANQASCPHCKAYARWAVERDDSDADVLALHVKCRDCDSRWRIEC